MKGILNFLKGVLKIGSVLAVDVVSAYSSPLGNLLERILGAVVHVEAALPGSGQGASKDLLASMLLTNNGDAIAAAFGAVGKPIVNPALFAAGVGKIQSGVVDILNSTGEKAKLPVV